MKRLLIYPFTKNMCPIVRHRDMLVGYEISAAIPAKGYGWEGKDACELDGGLPTGIILGGSFYDEVELCDAVLFNCDEQISEKDKSETEALLKAYGKDLVATIPCPILDNEEKILPNMPLKEVPVPVIMIMGQGENCQKFDIQLGLRKVFQEKGYIVSQFGTKPFSELFGFKALPSTPEVPLWKKVYMYNQLFRETYEKEKPDVMIVGIPGGIMPINSYEYELFGETALALTAAARPDVAFLSYYYVEPTAEYFELLRQYARFRLGVGEIYFHASNTRYIEEKSHRILSYLTLESQFVLDKLNKYRDDPSLHLFNALLSEASEPIYSNVVEHLQQNICVL